MKPSKCPLARFYIDALEEDSRILRPEKSECELPALAIKKGYVCDDNQLHTHAFNSGGGVVISKKEMISIRVTSQQKEICKKLGIKYSEIWNVGFEILVPKKKEELKILAKKHHDLYIHYNNLYIQFDEENKENSAKIDEKKPVPDIPISDGRIPLTDSGVKDRNTIKNWSKFKVKG